MTNINPCAQSASQNQSYAIMLAKLLMIAMEDFATMGMEDWSLRLRDGIEEIMVRYELKPEDIRFVKSQPRH
jgi:hypothetical protein